MGIEFRNEPESQCHEAEVYTVEADNTLQNKYSMVKGAARRARQLQSGAPALGVSKSMKACRVAEDEVRAGKVTYSLLAKKPEPPAVS